MPSALALGLLLPLLAAAQTPQGAKRLIEIVRTTGIGNAPRIDYSPRPLEDVSPADRPPAAAVSGYVRVFGSAAQNSRTPGSPKSGQWHVRWEAPVASSSSAVLLAGNRVLAQRSGGWTLFDREGKPIKEGISGGAAITLDPKAGLFYSLGNGNFLQAIGLEDGELRFSIPLGYNEFFAWPVFHPWEKGIIAAGVERPMISPKTRPPTRSLFQVIAIGSPLKLSPYKLLLSIDMKQDLLFKEPKMIPVASGDILWAVLPDLIIRTSPAQNVDGAWSGSFQAVSASADEAGWLHLLVVTSEGANTNRELWIVPPDGRRAMRATVPAYYAESKVPPAIGYDRKVYLRSGRSVAAFSPHGNLLWETQAGGSIAGLSVTPDGRVVAAVGKDLLAFDEKGNTTHLATLPAPATTNPVITADGDILVGTETAVLCLAPR